MSEPFQHPDLVELAEKMRRQLDAVLQAEQEAAAASRLRRRVLRDRLLEAEDRAEAVTVSDTAGRSWSGCVSAVGADHVMLGDRTFILLEHCAVVEFGT